MCLLCLVRPTAIAEKLVSGQSETTLYVDWQTVVQVPVPRLCCGKLKSLLKSSLAESICINWHFLSLFLFLFLQQQASRRRRPE